MGFINNSLGLGEKPPVDIKWNAYPITTKLLSFFANEHIWSLWREAMDMGIERHRIYRIVRWFVEEGSSIQEPKYDLDYS